MTKVKIIFDARGITPKPCGVRNVAENYLHELSGYYDIIALVNPETAGLIDEKIPRAVAPRFCSRFGLLSDFWVSYLVFKHRPSLFFSAHSFLPPIALLPRRKVFICHDLFAALDKSFFRKRGALAPLAQLFFRLLSEVSFFRASLVIAPSEAIRASFKGLKICAKREIVVHNGIADGDITMELPARRKQILFVGNFRSYKGFDTLYAAWKQFSGLPEANDWELVVVTNETEAAVRLFVQSREKLERLHFESRISDGELEKIRAQSSICVVPSRDEGFGIPLLEALNSGALVIRSDIPVFRELTKGFNDLVIKSFPVGDPKCLAVVLAEAVSEINQHGISTLHLNAANENKETLRNEYSWTAAAAKVFAEIR
ncbi:MAG: glycosyltransferase [Desulfurivibrionaceae bacterium]